MPWEPSETEVSGPESDDGQPFTHRCAWPGCPNPAKHALGCVKELGVSVALCAEHANGVVPNRGPVKPGQHGYRPWQNF
jgi:hypothetical protein